MILILTRISQVRGRNPVKVKEKKKTFGRIGEYDDQAYQSLCAHGEFLPEQCLVIARNETACWTASIEDALASGLNG